MTTKNGQKFLAYRAMGDWVLYQDRLSPIDFELLSKFEAGFPATEVASYLKMTVQAVYIRTKRIGKRLECIRRMGRLDKNKFMRDCSWLDPKIGMALWLWYSGRSLLNVAHTLGFKQQKKMNLEIYEAIDRMAIKGASHKIYYDVFEYRKKYSMLIQTSDNRVKAHGTQS
jgi:hypothetical protein